MYKAIIPFLLLSTIILNACSDQSSLLIPGKVTLVSGQSFGFCIGPCLQTMSINLETGDAKFYVLTTDGRGNQGATNEKTYDDKLSSMELKDIKKAYSDININKFQDTYGCPDCADGGAEWVQSITNDASKKVTFEYGANVEGMDKLINLLRSKRLELSKKYVTTNN